MILRSIKLVLNEENSSSFERLLKSTKEIIRKSVLFRFVWAKTKVLLIDKQQN